MCRVCTSVRRSNLLITTLFLCLKLVTLQVSGDSMSFSDLLSRSVGNPVSSENPYPQPRPTTHSRPPHVHPGGLLSYSDTHLPSPSPDPTFRPLRSTLNRIVSFLSLFRPLLPIPRNPVGAYGPDTHSCSRSPTSTYGVKDMDT